MQTLQVLCPNHDVHCETMESTDWMDCYSVAWPAYIAAVLLPYNLLLRFFIVLITYAYAYTSRFGHIGRVNVSQGVWCVRAHVLTFNHP